MRKADPHRTLYGQEQQSFLDDDRCLQESMAIEPVEPQDISPAIIVKSRQIIWQCRPHLRVEFEDSRFG
jgi:hypothetical protein